MASETGFVEPETTSLTRPRRRKTLGRAGGHHPSPLLAEVGVQFTLGDLDGLEASAQLGLALEAEQGPELCLDLLHLDRHLWCEIVKIRLVVQMIGTASEGPSPCG